MEREYRYLVVKYRDMLKYLSADEQTALIELAKKCDAGRKSDGKQIIECVVVESDWPEYFDTWSAIAARVDNVWLHKARMQKYIDYPETTTESAGEGAKNGD